MFIQGETSDKYMTMNIVIIEDEVETAWDIQNTIATIRPDFKILAVLDSIESATDWFGKNKNPDLVISDIQLGDGLAFAIFKKVQLTSPIIFCTAYNEYAMQAFETNSIDYILKPVNEKSLEKSIAKLESMFKAFVPRYNVDDLERLITDIYLRNKSYKTSLLVPYRSQLIPIQTNDIALFKIDSNYSVLLTKQGQKYPVSKTLDSLEEQLDPMNFHRANRQYIVSYSAISKVEHYDERKLLVKIKAFPGEHIVISKAKTTAFVRWMEDR
jgi:DNA-binding LytR/AlgR family response regulator